ncbi:MAG: Hsp20/alpha crystallin family protein [Nitrospinota bacterium]
MSPSDPFQELAFFQRRMQRLLEESLRGRRGPSPREQTLESPAWAPRVNIFERDEEVLIFVELPGVSSPEEVDLEFQEGLLSVSGVHREPDLGEGTERVLVEGGFGPFRRLISLPESADPGSITAKMKSGVLEIRAAKRKPRRLEITEFEN